MQSYTKIYLDHFDYCIDDFIPCECCQGRATEIHHIHNRSHRRDLLNDINNIMAICRICHTKYGDKKQFVDFLQDIHNKKLNIWKDG